MSIDANQYSGRFVLRIDPRLHASLRARAEEAGMSLNEFCARKLEEPDEGMSEFAAGVVKRGGEVIGPRLLGVVAFGSWARGDLTAGSDIDLLVVAGRDVTLRRELYEAWDEEPVTWSARPVEPHFVHLVDAEGRISGLWAEVAVDGIVLYEKEFLISRALGVIRRRVVAGELIRHWAHGHPYWTEAA